MGKGILVLEFLLLSKVLNCGCVVVILSWTLMLWEIVTNEAAIRVLETLKTLMMWSKLQS